MLIIALESYVKEKPNNRQRSNPFPPELDETLQNCLNITLGLRNEKAYIKSNLESANVQYRKVHDKIAEINEICRPKHG